MPSHGAGGRPRKPTPIRELEGNPGHREIPDEPPIPPLEDLAPPAWVRSVAARKAWAEIAPVLDAAGVLAAADPIALGLLCEAFGRYLSKRTSANMRDVKQLLEQFGMTPASRSKVSPVAKREPDNAWDKLDAMGV